MGVRYIALKCRVSYRYLPFILNDTSLFAQYGTEGLVRHGVQYGWSQYGTEYGTAP